MERGDFHLQTRYKIKSEKNFARYRESFEFLKYSKSKDSLIFSLGTIKTFFVEIPFEEYETGSFAL